MSFMSKRKSDSVVVNSLERKVMEEMGWATDSYIPMANAENLMIMKEIEELTQKKFEATERLKSIAERDKVVAEHIKSIDAAIDQNQTLYKTISGDLIKEEHLYKLAHAECSKIKQDLVKTQKEREQFSQLKEGIELKLKNFKNEITSLTERYKSAQSTLLQWTEAMKDNNKGYELIEKYHKEDQQRAKEKNKRRQDLQLEIDKRRKALDTLYCQQHTLEKALEGTASLYRAAHHERRQMIESWKSAVNKMTHQESDIQDGELMLEDLQILAAQKADEYAENNNELDRMIGNNREIEATIENVNKDSSDIKTQMQRITELSYLKQREIDTLQKDLADLGNRLELQRKENRLRQKEKLAKIEEIETFDVVLEKTQERLTNIENKKMNAAQRLQMLEDLNDGEEKTLNDLEKMLHDTNERLFHTQQTLTKLKDERKILDLNNHSLLTRLSSLKHNQKNAEKELKRQKAVFYDIKFKYLENELKLGRLKGVNIDPEIEARKKENLNRLKIYYKEIEKRIKQLDLQNNKLDGRVKSMVTILDKHSNDNKNANERMTAEKRNIAGRKRRIKEINDECKLLVVELDLIKMQCNSKETDLEKFNEGSFNLEKHRLQMQQTVKDRLTYLRTQEHLLKLKRKHLNDELSTLRADLGERNKCIEAMRTRFELTAELLGTNEDGTLVTTTQLKVKCAQEKQLLIDEGEQLKEKVLQAEKDVIALENTMKQFDISNDIYRKSFQKDIGNVNVKLNEDLKRLQTDYCEKLNQLKLLRCKVERTEQELEQRRQRQAEMYKKLDLVRANYQENSAIYVKAQDDLNEQKYKILRADRELRELRRQLRARPIDNDFLENFDREFYLQNLEERNMRALNQLADMAMTEPEYAKVVDIMVNKGLPLPHHSKRTHSISNTSTTRSSSTSVVSFVSSSTPSINLESDSSSHLSVVSLEFVNPVIKYID